MNVRPHKKKDQAAKDVPSDMPGDIHFTPELIAHMATFADASISPDVMNICLAVGPAVSRTIKHVCLRRNKKYLTDTLKNLVVRFGFNLSRASYRKKAGANHKAWMEVNTDWKTMAVSDDSISTLGQTHFDESTIKESGPFVAFNHTMFALQLGLLEVVKFLIEDKGVDPNEFMYGWTFNNMYSGGVFGVHLVSAAMTFGQDAIFEYLLSLPSTNLYSEKHDANHFSGHHGLFDHAVDFYVGRAQKKVFLTSFVNHNRFDVNRKCHKYSTPTTCLFIALHKLENRLIRIWSRGSREIDSERLDRHIDVIKLLLEAGANPTQSISDDIGNSFDLVELRLSQARKSSIRLLREKVYGQVLAMMKEAQAP